MISTSVLVTTSKALVTSSDALVPNSLLFLQVEQRCILSDFRSVLRVLLKLFLSMDFSIR